MFFTLESLQLSADVTYPEHQVARSEQPTAVVVVASLGYFLHDKQHVVFTLTSLQLDDDVTYPGHHVAKSAQPAVVVVVVVVDTTFGYF